MQLKPTTETRGRKPKPETERHTYITFTGTPVFDRNLDELVRLTGKKKSELIRSAVQDKFLTELQRQPKYEKAT